MGIFFNYLILFFENKLLVGYNFFYDLDLDNSHERFGIGTDMLTSLGDIHLNYYDAITESAVATLYNPMCSKLKLPLEKYESWKDLKITIDYSWVN